MAVTQEEHLKELAKGYRFDWKDPSHAVFEPKRGLNERVVEEISALKQSPGLDAFRLKSLVLRRRRCRGGAPTCQVDFQNIYYFRSFGKERRPNWTVEELQSGHGTTGTVESPGKYLGGVSAQYESEVVYHKIKDELDQMGVLFTDMDSARCATTPTWCASTSAP